MTLPFGKHRGRDISEVGTPYLRWMLENCHDLPFGLLAAIRVELHARGDRGDSVTRTISVSELKPTLRVWYRKLAAQFHPDRGGSNEGMMAINAAKDLLCEMLHLGGAA